MNVRDYADTLNLEIRVTRYANQNERWSASFENCEIKESAGSCLLIGAYGNGIDASSAIGDYIDQIRGKTLVHNAMSETHRRELIVPITLTLD